MEALFSFPPVLRIPSGYARFSWLACAFVVGPLVAFVASWFFSDRRHAPAPSLRRVAARGFPSWGWIALAWTVGWWMLAWTRFPWFAALQRFTFFPLWLGFVVTFNALAWRRAGSCLMLRQPRKWMGLFLASAGFWWGFEWLNRFVRNWHYLGVADFGPVLYAVNATICFSTVLPAVTAAREWAGTFPSLEARLAAGPRWPWLDRRATGWVLGLSGAGALLLTGAQPQEFYPALWAAPLALGLAAEILSGKNGLAREVATGDWRRAGAWMIGALLCGFFWEMWNVHSAAKWIYTVPYVDRWHVFEMPLLGYAGYLPFGLECCLVIAWLFGRLEPASR